MKKFLDYFSKFVFLSALIFFFYGMIKFPDSPVAPCGENRYCGKQGQSHTSDDFETFNRWRAISAILIPSAILLMMINEWIKKKREPEKYLPEE